MIKFLAGLAILALALFLQIYFGSIGFLFNIVLGVLIAFASVFDFWEVLFFDFLAIYILNWEPALSIAVITFAAIPVLAYFALRAVRSQGWIGNLAAIFAGFMLFYLIAAPAVFAKDIAMFLLNLAIGLASGTLVFFALN